MFTKVLTANRGEIAVRIARTCRRLNVASVAVYSDADEGALHVAVADESFRLPGRTPAETYLDGARIIEAAQRLGAEAIHPGYGFLSENPDFADAVEAAGLVWVGPSPDAIRALGDKISARRIASGAGVPVVPGLLDEAADERAIEDFAGEHGWPVAIKAAAGGGGRGLKIAHSSAEVAAALASARREAVAYFGSPVVYVERYLDGPKHLEVQVLATPDEAMWLGVRDCSLQRRHQKLIEETPPPRWAERAAEMGEAAVALAKASGYVNAGTVEMLVDDAGRFFFLEVNSRLQVEHTVTEEVLGIDLVECQLRIASGDALPLSQADLDLRGHSIECRINAENPRRDFAPSPGRLVVYEEPNAPSVRVDSGYREGDEIPAEYDSLIAKVIATGRDREEARVRMVAALRSFVIEGVSTTIPAHLMLLEQDDFRQGTHTTRTVEDGALAGLSDAEHEEGTLLVEGRAIRLWHPAMSSSAAAAVHSEPSSGEVHAPMHGTILNVLVEAGVTVGAGDPIVVLEAMKMETTLSAPRSGRVAYLGAAPGAVVGSGELLAIVE